MVVISKIVIAVIIVVIAIVVIIFGIVFATSPNNDCEDADIHTELTISKADQNIILTWNSKKSERCSITYMIRYSIDNSKPVEANITDSSYNLPLLEACSLLSVYIWSLNEVGELSEQYIMKEYVEIPTENLFVTDITLFSEPDEAILTYNRPINLDKCNIKYNITVITDLRRLTLETQNVSIVIEDSKYCAQIDVYITVVIDETYSFFPVYRSFWTGMEAVQGIQVYPLSEDSNKLLVSWDPHPKAEICSLNYRVVHIFDGKDDVVQETTTLNTSFNFTYCEYTIVVIQAFNTKSGITSRLFAKDVIIMPSQIPKVTNLTITQASWTPVEIGECVTIYAITLLTDIDSYTELTEVPIFKIPDTKYCGILKLQAKAIIGQIAGDSESTSESVVLQDLVGLEIFLVSNQLIVSWSRHPREKICDLQYKVVYSVQDMDYEVIETPNAEVTFTVVYCAKAIISVTPCNIHFSGNATAIDATQNPSSIERVQNITIDVIGTTATISWYLPADLSLCVHTVTAINDEKSEYQATCTGSSSCELTLDDFCPRTTFIITAMDIIGDPAEKVYSCDINF